jgi:hypothetical protein
MISIQQDCGVIVSKKTYASRELYIQQNIELALNSNYEHKYIFLSNLGNVRNLCAGSILESSLNFYKENEFFSVPVNGAVIFDGVNASANKFCSDYYSGDFGECYIGAYFDTEVDNNIFVNMFHCLGGDITTSPRTAYICPFYLMGGWEKVSFIVKATSYNSAWYDMAFVGGTLYALESKSKLH